MVFRDHQLVKREGGGVSFGCFFTGLLHQQSEKDIISKHGPFKVKVNGQGQGQRSRSLKFKGQGQRSRSF